MHMKRSLVYWLTEGSQHFGLNGSTSGLNLRFLKGKRGEGGGRGEARGGPGIYTKTSSSGREKNRGPNHSANPLRFQTNQDVSHA